MIYYHKQVIIAKLVGRALSLEIEIHCEGECAEQQTMRY